MHSYGWSHACDEPPGQQVHDAARRVGHTLPIFLRHLPARPVPIVPIHTKSCVLPGHSNKNAYAPQNNHQSGMAISSVNSLDAKIALYGAGSTQ